MHNSQIPDRQLLKAYESLQEVGEREEVTVGSFSAEFPVFPLQPLKPRLDKLPENSQLDLLLYL